MSTNYHQVVGKCDSSGIGEFTGENILGRETPCVFSPKYCRGSVSASSGLALRKLSEISARDCSGAFGSLICISKR